MALDRLIRGDRIVWQQREGECFPEAVWWEKKPRHWSPTPWLSTAKWLRSHGLITIGLVPKDSIYAEIGHALFVATPAAIDAFTEFQPIIFCVPKRTQLVSLGGGE